MYYIYALYITNKEILFKYPKQQDLNHLFIAALSSVMIKKQYAYVLHLYFSENSYQITKTRL